MHALTRNLLADVRRIMPKHLAMLMYSLFFFVPTVAIIGPNSSTQQVVDASARFANIRWVTASWNWLQIPADDLGTSGRHTIHLSPCPSGLDTKASANHYTYKVYISGKGTPEAVAVTGGNCPAGTGSGTIIVTTAYAHGAGYTVGSASTGIQEAWNDAWVNDFGSGPGSQSLAAPYVKLMADTTYTVYSPVFLRGRGGVLDGAGALLLCATRDRCVYVGIATTPGPSVTHHKIYNLTGSSSVNVGGVQVGSVSATGGTYTVTTASNHPFMAGDTVDCEYHSQTADQHWAAVVLAAGLTNTTFEVQIGTSATFSAGANTFGWCGLLNAFIENNSDHVALQDVNIFQSNSGGLGQFSYGIVNDNDQQFVITRATNRSSSVIRNDANWPMGTFFYQRTDQGNAGIMYIHDSEIGNVNCATGGGNGMVVTDTVCQGFPLFGVRYNGSLQPITVQNMYQESTGGTANPLYGYAAQAGYVIGGGQGNRILGTFPVNGFSPVFAAGGGPAAQRNYFVVPRSSTAGYGPVLFIGSAQPTNGIVSIPLVWPSIVLMTSAQIGLGTLTWDILVTTGTATPPFGTGNYAIATNVSGTCGTNGMCSYTDTQSGTSSYYVQTQQFNPVFWFWPVNLVLNGTSPLLVDQIGSDPSAVSSIGTQGVAIIAEQCHAAGWWFKRTPLWVTCLSSENSGGAGGFATVLQQIDFYNNGPAANDKGRLNFGKAIAPPNDVITLVDSNLAKTLATAGERPSNDARDIAIGLDQAGGLAERAPTSISEYIDAVPSGPNYQERLTAEAKTFKVPIATPPATLVLSTSPIAANTCRTQGVPLLGARSTSVIKWSFANNPIGITGYGNGALQVSTFSTPNTANVVVCNITGSLVTPGAISLNIREEL